MPHKAAALFTVPATAHGPPTFEEAARYLRIDVADMDRGFSPALIDPQAELYCVRAFVSRAEGGFADVEIRPLGNKDPTQP